MQKVISLFKNPLAIGLTLCLGVAILYALTVKGISAPVAQEGAATSTPAEVIATSTNPVASTTPGTSTTTLPTPPIAPQPSDQGTSSSPFGAFAPGEQLPVSAADCHKEPFLSKFANPGECMRAIRGI